MLPLAGRVLFYLLISAVSGIVFATFSQYGKSWDEEVQHLYGQHIMRWYVTRFSDLTATRFGDLYLYGGFYEVAGGGMASLLSSVFPLGLYEARHLINAIFGLLAVVSVYVLASHLGGAMAGFLAALLLTLSPVFYGHMFNNPKDIPFAALHALALCYAVRSYDSLPRVPWSLVLTLGVSIGLTLGVRIGGLLLLGYLGLLWGGWWMARTRETARRGRPSLPEVRRMGGALVSVILLAWAVMLMWWPWAQLKPLRHPLHAAQAITHFPWPGIVFFHGRFFEASELPRWYLPTWLAISLPDFYFIALAIGGFYAVKTVLNQPRSAIGVDTAIKVSVLMVAVLLPILTAIGLRPTMYDGMRHFLFLLPPLAVLAGISLARFFQERQCRTLKVGVGLLLGTSLIFTVTDMIQLHPYQTVYFNRLLSGGMRSASLRFETDYWGHSYHEGAEWVVKNYQGPGRQVVRVAACGPPHLIRDVLEGTPERRARFQAIDPFEDAHLFLATTRFKCHEILQSLGQRVLHRVERQGVPLLYVFELRGANGHALRQAWRRAQEKARGTRYE